MRTAATARYASCSAWRCRRHHPEPPDIVPDSAPTPLARRTRLAAVLLALPWGAGCGDPPPDKQLDTLRSWTATMELAAADRARGAVGARYAVDLRQRATEALAGASIEKGAGAPPGTDRSRALAAADSLRRAIAALDRVMAR